MRMHTMQGINLVQVTIRDAILPCARKPTWVSLILILICLCHIEAEIAAATFNTLLNRQSMVERETPRIHDTFGGLGSQEC